MRKHETRLHSRSFLLDQPVLWSAVLCTGLLFFSPRVQAQDEKIDMATIQKIRQEGLQNSHVMDIAFHLTDASGDRLTASPGFNRAANWAKQQLTQWGLTGATLDPWGEFGKGWELQKSYLALTAPYYKPLIAFPKAWCGGTNGLKSASVLLITTDSASLDRYRGQLAGKILILDVNQVYQQSFRPDANRYTDEQLDSMSKVVIRPVDTAELRRRRAQFNRSGATMLNTLKAMAVAEGAIAILSQSPRGHDGTLFVQGGGPYQAASPANFLDIVIAMEDYGTIVRLLKAGTPVMLDAEVATKFQTDDTKGYNVIAEIKAPIRTGAMRRGSALALISTGMRYRRSIMSWLHRHDGSGKDTQNTGHSTPSYDPHRAMERRGRRAARLQGICQKDLWRSRDQRNYFRTKLLVMCTPISKMQQRHGKSQGDLSSGQRSLSPHLHPMVTTLP